MKLQLTIAICLFAGGASTAFANSEQEQSCMANYSVNTGSLIVPCVRVSSDDLPNTSHSAIMQQQTGEFTFVLSKMTSRLNSEKTACDATYDSTTQIVRIPCLSIIDSGTVTNPDALHAVYMRHDVDKNVFTLTSSLEARESMTTGNVTERELRRWFYNQGTLPDVTSFSVWERYNPGYEGTR